MAPMAAARRSDRRRAPGTAHEGDRQHQQERVGPREMGVLHEYRVHGGQRRGGGRPGEAELEPGDPREEHEASDAMSAENARTRMRTASGAAPSAIRSLAPGRPRR